MNDDVKNLIICSGGGACFGWQLDVVNGLEQAGFTAEMYGTTSTGTICANVMSKKIYHVGRKLCDEIYADNARGIFKPGIGSIKDGKLTLDWFKALKDLIFRKNKIKSLMDNQPLFDLLLKLDTDYPGYPTPIFYNVIDMISGGNIEYSTQSPVSQFERIWSMVASTSIPVALPLVKDYLGDGGIREGTPLSAMFARVGSGKKRIIVVACNDDAMKPATDLSRIDKIAGRALNIALNEIQVNDLSRTDDRNKVAKAISEHRHELPKEFLDKLPGYDYAPIYVLKYTGPSTTFSFTTEALAEQREHAAKTVENFVYAMNNTK